MIELKFYFKYSRKPRDSSVEIYSQSKKRTKYYLKSRAKPVQKFNAVKNWNMGFGRFTFINITYQLPSWKFAMQPSEAWVSQHFGHQPQQQMKLSAIKKRFSGL